MYLEELHADAGKHELQQCGDDQDVADSSDGHKHTLHHILGTNIKPHNSALGRTTRCRQEAVQFPGRKLTKKGHGYVHRVTS